MALRINRFLAGAALLALATVPAPAQDEGKNYRKKIEWSATNDLPSALVWWTTTVVVGGGPLGVHILLGYYGRIVGKRLRRVTAASNADQFR